MGRLLSVQILIMNFLAVQNDTKVFTSGNENANSILTLLGYEWFDVPVRYLLHLALDNTKRNCTVARM